MTVYSTPSYDYSRYSVTPSPPPNGSILYDLEYTDELIAVKVALRNQLKHNKLPNTPAGFPVFFRSAHARFPCTATGHDSVQFQSHEFYQEVYTSDRRSKKMAKISFIAPRKSCTGMLKWTISVPARGSFGWQNDEDISVISHVEVHPSVLEHPHAGVQIMASPRVIYEALAVSLELGALVTLTTGAQGIINGNSKKGPCTSSSSAGVVMVWTDQYGQSKSQSLFF